MGVHVLDVLVRPVQEIPEGQGATLVDDIRMTAAGTAGGTALTLAKLGAEVRTAGAVGSDPTGDMLIQLLKRGGVDTGFLVRRTDTATSASVLPIRPNGDRPSLHLLGANITYGPDDVPWDALAEATHLHLGGPELIGVDAAARILSYAGEHGVVTSVDLLAPGVLGSFEQIEAALPHIDHLLPNEDQVLGFTGESDLLTGARKLLADAEREAEHVQAGLRRLAHPGAEGRLPVVEAMGRRLEELLLGEASGRLGPGPVVVVPPARLHRVPWALLPALRERVVSVSPSASGWLRARETEPPPDGRHVLVRGPGLATCGAEVPEVAGRYGAPVVLEHEDARVPRVLAELDGAALAHIAAHGTFRADSPMFSSLRMADGPLIVHDFERLARSPYRIILSSCDTARLASVGADELLGLVTALLPLGTAGVIASSAPVNDAAVVPLMLALHEGLRRGLSLAEALRDARAALPGDALHQATGWAFTAFGAA
ncbi:PfkB family carbohydrate kinase [Streptomyces sp. ID05-04B]|uniref:PfkB family carbohydrate kinase n=1 Tax=Streptomyces sp. ID05-04B TaxID=3028661 RepID=UPI0039F6B4EE